ncbi:glycosyltransferase [Glycomyces sp. YM15]|uniref:glycosyltransferase n=1 Tax=Glycomyces sp. YM15 TaxID=2800446 RepID=UPI00196399E1|nr:glycosyltransferase [Glycomyces sp. YM15]
MNSKTRTHPNVDRRIVVAFGTAAATMALPFVLDPPYALAAAGLALVVLIGFGRRTAVRLRRLGRDIAAKQSAADLFGARAEQALPCESGERRAQRVFEALDGGFPVSAVREAREIASDQRIPLADRLALLRAVEAWQMEAERSRVSPPERVAFDVVLVSHLGLPGDAAAATIAKIEACRDLGLTIGLLHHPVHRWHPNAPIGPEVEALIDGEQVRAIGLDQEVECALAVVRTPVALMFPLERRPRVTAGRTVVIADQTPFESYGAQSFREKAWDLGTVDRHVTDWLGEHTWYAGGPLVRAALLEHHAEELAGLDLAPEPWNDVIEIDRWRLDARRVPDGRIRIGRHARDHRLQWPDQPKTLLECYPDREPFEIHVLGGAEAPARLLKGLPENWTVHPFDALAPKAFLAEVDVMAFFAAADGAAAFGRAPLEAMAAGVPVIMDRRLEPAYGPAAVYCDPGEVASVAEALTADPDAYAAQQAAAWSHLADRFSVKALMDRLPLAAAAGAIG